MSRFTLLILSVFLLGLSGCVQVDPEPVSGNPPGGSAETIAGTDADGDGVRDDVQSHIQVTYTDAATQAAVTRLAKGFQALLVNTSGKPGALTAAASLNAAIDCLYTLDSVDFVGQVEDIEGRTVNTATRARAYARAGSQLSGGNFTVSAVTATCGVTP